MYKFEKLTVWQKAMDLCEIVYKESRNIPKEELFGLTSQLRRAATSIPLNISEGTAAGSKKEFKRFLNIALCSQYETATIIRLCLRLKHLDNKSYGTINSSLEEVGKLLHGLIRSLQQPPTDTSNHQPTQATTNRHKQPPTRQQAQQPTTNNQQPTTNNQQPTTNNQQPTTNNRQPTTNNQQPTTDNRQPTTNNQQPTTNNQQPTTDNRQPTTNNRQPTTNNQQHDNKQPTTIN
jgi:four helix bundle protein